MVTEQEREQEVVEIQPRYFIDLSWYGEQGRSFAALATSRLCPVSRKKEKSKTDTALIRVIKQCCSKREGFVTPTMPLLEMVFRLLLANGNLPLGLDEIQEQLQKYLGDTSAKDISLPKLKRIIENDRYYGLRQAPDSEED